MRILSFFVAAGLGLASPSLAVAQSVDSDGEVTSGYVETYLRDSDGNVISVLVRREWEYAYGTSDPTDFEVTLQDDRIYAVALPRSVTSATTPQHVSLNGASYQIARAGKELFLRAKDGSQYRLNRLGRSDGKRVNPTAFGLD